MDGHSSRRRFLKETLFGVIALAAAKIIPLDSVHANSTAIKIFLADRVSY